MAATALTNIIENAIEACIEDPSGRSHRIIFGVDQDKENIIFDIRDNGVGMDDEIRDNIFNLFYSSKGKRHRAGLVHHQKYYPAAWGERLR